MLILLLLSLYPYSFAETVIEPEVPVPDYVRHLLEIASDEVGYTEGEHGYSKYGQWAGDPYCQWCAEFLCWCVDQTDLKYGTSLLNIQYPKWSGSNTGRSWFIRTGRYVIRKGEVDGWGYEWLKGTDAYLASGDYIPQPGDYVFFTWTADTDTDHVALVEFCTRDENGAVQIHVIEGNNPSSVSRNIYSVNDGHILGYGTVHDMADITMRFGNNGEKVTQLQEKLVYMGFLDEQYISGNYGNATTEAVKQFQTAYGLKVNGIANRTTQLRLDAEIEAKINADPFTWIVIDDED